MLSRPRSWLLGVTVLLLGSGRAPAQSPDVPGPAPVLQLPALAPRSPSPPLARLTAAVPAVDEPELPPEPIPVFPDTPALVVPVAAPAPAGDLGLAFQCSPLWFLPDSISGERPVILCNVPLKKRDGTGLLDNFYVFAGLDGSKEPEDLGINANFGARIHFNWGIPFWQEEGIGIQVGSGLNFRNNAERGLSGVSGTSDSLQSFTSLGLFQRTESGLNWGFTYDFRFDDYYREIDTSQWRFQVGQTVGPNDELGVWGTVHERTAGAVLANQLYHFEAINQYNVFWRHVWPNDTATRVWVGVAEGHDRFVLGQPAGPRIDHPIVFGADFYVPLNDSVFLFGEANFITPNDTGTVTATLGVAITWGGARNAVRGRFAPLLPVANNSSFAVNVRP